jgi:hypothetical protein
VVWLKEVDAIIKVYEKKIRWIVRLINAILRRKWIVILIIV